MNPEEPRYSLKTLKALYYGALYGGVSAHGTLRVQLTEGSFITEGRVLSIGAAGLCARTDDGSLKNVRPTQILHAEVI